MSIEAMKMALEALEMFCEHGAILRPLETVETLRQAIEQAEKQEPVAWIFESNYTAPEREWVEITKGECDELFRAASDHIEYAYAIEAKLKEKNT